MSKQFAFSGKKYARNIFFLAILGGLLGIIYGEIKENKLRTLPKKYVYGNGRPLKSAILYIRKLKYKKEYLQYEKDSRAGKNPLDINFPYENVLPENEIIYIRKYLKDSNLVEFYNPYYHSKLWGFTTGYIHKNFIHDTPREK